MSTVTCKNCQSEYHIDITIKWKYCPRCGASWGYDGKPNGYMHKPVIPCCPDPPKVESSTWLEQDEFERKKENENLLVDRKLEAYQAAREQGLSHAEAEIIFQNTK